MPGRKAARMPTTMRPKAASPPLHYALLGTDETRLKKLLDLGADPESSDDRGRTPIHIACAGPLESPIYLPMVRELHPRSAGLNAKTTKGLTPIQIASRTGNRDIVRDLNEEAGGQPGCHQGSRTHASSPNGLRRGLPFVFHCTIQGRKRSSRRVKSGFSSFADLRGTLWRLRFWGLSARSKAIIRSATRPYWGIRSYGQVGVPRVQR